MRKIDGVVVDANVPQVFIFAEMLLCLVQVHVTFCYRRLCVLLVPLQSERVLLCGLNLSVTIRLRW